MKRKKLNQDFLRDLPFIIYSKYYFLLYNISFSSLSEAQIKIAPRISKEQNPSTPASTLCFPVLKI